MDSSAAQRRLKAIHGHFATDGESHPQLRPNPTAGEFFIGTFSLSLSLCARKLYVIVCLICDGERFILEDSFM